MSPPVGVRRAVMADRDSLDQLCSEVLPRPVFKDYLEAQGVFSYLAEEEQPFGVVTVGRSGDVGSRHTGELLAWFVAPSCRGRGWGGKLLIHGMSVLKRRLFEEAFIWVPSDSEAAIHIVERIGFDRHGSERVDNQTGQTSLGYIRLLDDFF